MRPLLDTIPVFYSEHMLAETDSFSPSVAKPRHVLDAWIKAGLPIAVRPFAPASALDLCLAHDPTGAMIAAGRLALPTGCACAPVSGFHHAHSDSAGGYQEPQAKVIELHVNRMRECVRSAGRWSKPGKKT